MLLSFSLTDPSVYLTGQEVPGKHPSQNFPVWGRDSGGDATEGRDAGGDVMDTGRYPADAVSGTRRLRRRAQQYVVNMGWAW